MSEVFAVICPDCRGQGCESCEYAGKVLIGTKSKTNRTIQWFVIAILFAVAAALFIVRP